MARKPKQQRARARSAGLRFDPRQLTERDHQLLAAFAARRAAYEQALAASNILYHKHTCPACGLPSLDARGDHETCVVCLWEDSAGENDLTIVSAPNYVSLLQARVEAAAHLAEFERTHELPASLEEIVHRLRDFTRRAARGEVGLDRHDFAANLGNILGVPPAPTSPCLASHVPQDMLF